MFKKIVVAVDGSEQSHNALTTACDLAKKYTSELYLLHSPQLETTAIAVGSGAVAIKPTKKAIVEAGKKVIDIANENAVQQGCKPTDCIIANGNPADEILDISKKLNADLIVMGRRGLGGVKSILLGSVSQKVSHGAPCTLMTVNHR